MPCKSINYRLEGRIEKVQKKFVISIKYYICQAKKQTYTADEKSIAPDFRVSHNYIYFFCGKYYSRRKLPGEKFIRSKSICRKRCGFLRFKSGSERASDHRLGELKRFRNRFQ